MQSVLPKKKKKKERKKRKQKKRKKKNNRGRLESFANDYVLMQNNAEHPKVRNGWDDAKQKMPEGTTWVDCTVISPRYFLPYTKRWAYVIRSGE